MVVDCPAMLAVGAPFFVLAVLSLFLFPLMGGPASLFGCSLLPRGLNFDFFEKEEEEEEEEEEEVEEGGRGGG